MLGTKQGVADFAIDVGSERVQGLEGRASGGSVRGPSAVLRADLRAVDLDGGDGSLSVGDFLVVGHVCGFCGVEEVPGMKCVRFQAAACRSACQHKRPTEIRHEVVAQGLFRFKSKVGDGLVVQEDGLARAVLKIVSRYVLSTARGTKATKTDFR